MQKNNNKKTLATGRPIQYLSASPDRAAPARFARRACDAGEVAADVVVVALAGGGRQARAGGVARRAARAGARQRAARPRRACPREDCPARPREPPQNIRKKNKQTLCRRSTSHQVVFRPGPKSMWLLSLSPPPLLPPKRPPPP